jgi:uncharacterized alkaline shock family protein YloU
MGGQAGSSSTVRTAPPRSRHQTAAVGRTVISDAAVAKVAAAAARSVPGVHALGAGSGRGLGTFRESAGTAELSQGVRAEAGETEAAVDITLVADYGQPLQLLANHVRAAVYAAVEKLVGLRVIEVNVEISNVYISGYEQDKPGAKSRTGMRPNVVVQPGRVRPGPAAAGRHSLNSKEQP